MANQKNTKKLKSSRAKSEKTVSQGVREERSGGRAVKSSGISRTRYRKSMPKKQYELMVLSVMGLAVLLAIAVYFRNSGNFLGSVRYFVFGILGVSAYLLPIVMFVSTLFKAFNQGNQRLDDKIKLAVLAILDISVFAHIFYVLQPQINLNLGKQKLFFPVLANFYRVSGRHQVGGGFVGGLFGDSLLILLGKWGSFVVALLIFFAILLLLTEISLVQVLDILKKIVLAVYRWISRQIMLALERREAKKAEQSEAEAGWEQAIIENELAELAEHENPAEGEALAEEKPKKKKKLSFLNIDLTPEGDLEDPVMEADREVQAESEKGEEPAAEEKSEATGESIAEAEADKEESLPEESLSAEADLPVKEQPTPERINPYLAAEKKSEPKDTSTEKKQSLAEQQKSIQEEMQLKGELKSYAFPPIELMKEPVNSGNKESELIESNAQKLEETLQSFGVSAKVINVSQGPTVTRYEVQPAQGVKVSRIVGLSDDIALNLAAAGIRMEAPIPGKSAIGIEVPNNEAGSVMLREVIDSPEFQKSGTKLSFGLGKDIAGRVLVTDIAKMPHLLIAGATGSGKSVCINTLIVSLLYKAKPEEVRLLMIDPKVVELSIYNGIPHLLIPVVTDAKKAAGALNWAVQEMNDRYKLFSAAAVRDLKGYNKVVEEKGDTPKLPQIVIIVDELADLMMVASNEVEDAIVRLSQMARAAGLHLIIATQRPSVDVITGLIKANVPSRIAFNVSSGTDSRTIIDMNGAEKLLGKGDMLFYPTGYPKPVRIQGAFISDHEVENIVEYLKTQQQTQYNQKIMNHLNKSEDSAESEIKDDLDEFFADALELVVDKERASASMIQRYFRVGFNRAARIIDQLAEAGYIGEEQGSKPREVLLTRRELEELKAKANAGADEKDKPETEKRDFAIKEDATGKNDAASLQQIAEPDKMDPDTSIEIESLPSSEWSENSNRFTATDHQPESEEEPINDAINDMLEEIQAREE